MKNNPHTFSHHQRFGYSFCVHCVLAGGDVAISHCGG